MEGGMDAWMDGGIVACMDGGVSAWMEGGVSAWRDECMDGWVDKWMIWANFRTLSANEAKVLTFLRKFTLLNVHASSLYKGLSLYDPNRRRPW